MNETMETLLHEYRDAVLKQKEYETDLYMRLYYYGYEHGVRLALISIGYTVNDLNKLKRKHLRD
jgi:hypothetical protein